MNDKNLSMKEIAELADVSIATVSRVLNNKGKYSAETEKRVKAVIEKYDYKVNHVGKSLRTQQTKSIGLILQDITNEFFASLVLAIENKLLNKGYTVLLCNANEDPKLEKLYLEELTKRAVDGILYIAGQTEFIPKNHIPIVCIDRKPKNSTGVTTVESDNYSGGVYAAREFNKIEIKKTLLIFDHRLLSTTVDRIRGFKDALKNKNIKELPVEVTFQGGFNAIKKEIESGEEFDSIFATTDWLAIGALNAIKKYIPEKLFEIKVIGFDDISLSKYGYPRLTTIFQNREEISKYAVEAILGKIEGKEDYGNIKVPVRLIKRDTT